MHALLKTRRMNVSGALVSSVPMTPVSEAPAMRSSLRVFAPLVPDMQFGRSWGEWVEGYAQRFGVLPQVFRVVRLSPTQVVIGELQVDAAGYGRVCLAGELRPEALPTVLVGLMGRFGRAIVDEELLDAVPASIAVVSDAALHARSAEELQRPFSVETERWRTKLAADLLSQRALPTRAAMERMRAEMMALVAVLQSAS